MKKSAITGLFCFIFSFTFSQNNHFKWEEGLSVYDATFDTQKYSHKQISQIYDYLLNQAKGMFEVGHVWDIHQMQDSTKITELDSFYTTASEIYKTMKLPEGKFWSNLLEQRKTELNEWYKAETIFLQSFYNPSILLDKAYPDCYSTAQALNGTDEELLEAWKVLVEEQKKRNCCPEEVEKKYLAELSSEYHLLYGRMELSIYAWWNCRNKYIPYVNDDTGLIFKEFLALFLNVNEIEMED